MQILFNNFFTFLVIFIISTFIYSTPIKSTIHNQDLSSSDFVITWDTTKKGISNNTSITIPTLLGIYYYNIDWDNDGVFDEIGINTSITHDFEKPGIYTIRINGVYPHFSFNNTGDKLKLIEINQWGTQKWMSMNGTFWGCENLIGKAKDKPDLSSVVDMDGMFEDAIKFNQNIGDWDTSNVNNMSGLFSGAILFNQNISNWNTSNVNDMSFMFNQTTSFNQNLNSWDTSKVTNMQAMFQLAVNFNGDIGNWNTEKVTKMSFMFSLAYEFNKYIGKWNIKNVTDISMMFQGAYTFNQNISNWNIQKVEKMNRVLYKAANFKQNLELWMTNNQFNSDFVTANL